MKYTILLLVGSLIASSLHAEYRTWTNREGDKAELQLVKVVEDAGEKAGKFRMLDGRMVTIKKSELSDEDAKLLKTPPPPVHGKDSVFDEYLWGKLIQVEGEKFEEANIKEKPKKYYVFYYTASWCGPCRNFTPKLVEWYKENKNENFEIFLITSDRKEKAMLGYAKKNQMEWPHLAYEDVRSFKEAFRSKHGVRGIPNLVVCTPEGEVLGNYRSKLSSLSSMVE